MFFRDNYPSKKKGLRLIAVSSINSNLEILNTLNKYLIYNDITNIDDVAKVMSAWSTVSDMYDEQKIFTDPSCYNHTAKQILMQT